MAKYSDDYRAQVITMLDAAGYSENKTKAVIEVFHYLNGRVPKRTLYRWGNRENRPAPAKLVTEKKGDLADALESLIWQLVEHATDQDTIDAMSGREASTSIGIYVDKVRLLRGLPTEIVAIMPDFVEALQTAGKDPKEFMSRVIDRINQSDYVQ